LSETVDAYETAAEDKVVEKVNDLVEQFRELGPQFEVVVLDVKEKADYDREKEKAAEGDQDEPLVTPVNEYREKRKGYYEKLAELPEELRKAVEAAPENSIFFHAGGRVQRLSFNDLYRLDKKASRRSRNLVLKDQGVEPFARMVFEVEAKRPRVGILVVHEWLTTEGPEEYGLEGLKKTLTAYGFDVRDIILKKWSEFAPPEPAVATYDETKLDRLEEELAEYDATVKALEEAAKQFRELQKDWEESTPEELTKKYAKNLGGKKVTEKGRTAQAAEFKRVVENAEARLADTRREREKTLKEKEGLNVDAATEQRRMSDLKARVDRLLADGDVLFIPRMTLRNVVLGDRIPNRAHNLNEAQTAAVEDFLKSGKPVFACFGPVNEPAGFGTPPEGPDKVE